MPVVKYMLCVCWFRFVVFCFLYITMYIILYITVRAGVILNCFQELHVREYICFCHRGMCLVLLFTGLVSCDSVLCN